MRRVRSRRWSALLRLTLSSSGEAAVASALPARPTLREHHTEPDCGLVRFNAGLGLVLLSTR